MHVVVHLFQADLFVAEHFTDEDTPLRVWNDFGYAKLTALVGRSLVLGT
jgi:hypothetical protein